MDRDAVDRSFSNWRMARETSSHNLYKNRVIFYEENSNLRLRVYNENVQGVRFTNYSSIATNSNVSVLPKR